MGTGISGLVVLALGPRVHRYIATDQTYVLKTLRNNIESNIVSDTSRQNKGSSNIDILELDWEQSNIDQLPALIPDLCKTQSHSGGLDVIVACDCIYNEALIPSFVDVCAELCSIGSKSLDENQSRDRSPPTICIVAQQLRSSIVLEAWLRYFHRRFQVWRIPDELLSEDLQEGKGFAVHIGIIR